MSSPDPFDPLDQLVEAYRAETAHRPRDNRALRARVITSLGARRRAPRALVWLGAVAVLFAGSAALAASGERTFTRLLALFRPHAAEAPAPAARERAVRRARPVAPSTASIPAPPAPPAPANPVDTSPTVVPLAALPLDEPPARTKRRSRNVELPVPPAPVDSRPDLGAELSSYRRAEALHFGGGSPAAALEAFRDYLSDHPQGALAAEARLNEAVCLVKLGKSREGRRILVVLAAGNAPQSTQQQARELLLALGPESAPAR